MSSLASALSYLDGLTAECVAAARAEAVELTDDLLLEHEGQLAHAARAIELAAAMLASEIGRRSRPELGYQGLAQKRGSRTPEALVQAITGASAPAARRLVRVGTMVSELTAHDADSSLPMTQPWLAPVLRAVQAGVLSAEAVEPIRAGLGIPTDSVTLDALTDAARQLVAEAATATTEVLAARARELRDRLDFEGVAAREEELRARRYLRMYAQADGMTRLVGLLDPESAAIVKNTIDAATSPRRGGPRFVDADDAARAAEIVADARTTEQIALDTLVELFDVAMRASDSPILGARRADVRVLVTQQDLDKRTGHGFIEGQTAAVSIATVERHACDGGLVPIMFDDDGRAMNLGRSHRFHTSQQRTVIAARDGGCINPGCDRPASWCEVHHIQEFSRGGRTDLADGVLLCRHHHMLMHNNGWHIDRRGSLYWLIPPAEIDPQRRPIELRTKSPAARRLFATV